MTTRIGHTQNENNECKASSSPRSFVRWLVERGLCFGVRLFMLFTPHRHPMLLNPIEPQRWLTVLLALLFSFGAFGEDAASPSPERPWSPPRLDKYERELAQEGARERPDAAKVAINPKKVYDLPELIDLAERNNPDTRVAWESARKAAAAVALSESAYYPYLMASAGAGYESSTLPCRGSTALKRRASSGARTSLPVSFS